MKVLITRPDADANPLADLLATKQVDSLTDPMLHIHWIDGPSLELDQVQGLLMTSANGVRAFSKRNQERHIPVYAVGDATRREADRSGYLKTHTASGDVEALAQLVLELAKPEDGALLHCAGTRQAGDLAGMLSEHGFIYRREVLYEAKAAQCLQAPTIAALKNHELDGVLLFSPRTATIFMNCLENSGCAPRPDQLTAYCLSQAVADRVQARGWTRVKIARKPTQDALIEIVLEPV